MKDMNFNGLDYIQADQKLIDSTVNKIMSSTKNYNHFNVKRSMVVAASLVVICGSAIFYYNFNNGNSDDTIASKTIEDSNINFNKSVPSNNISATETISNKDKIGNSITPNNPKTTTNITSNKNMPSSNAAKNSDKSPSNAVSTNNSSSNNTTKDNDVSNTPVTNNNGIYIPSISLSPDNGVSAKMIPLVVYNGKIYTQSATELNPKNIQNFIGEKIGRTSNSIDEWNVKDKSSEELASNIGQQDIYTVKGYDTDFRIMSYSKIEDQEYAQFFDCLNGITINSGNDIFGKLNLINNVESAKFISFDDWNNGNNTYITFDDIDLLNGVLIELNNAVPYNYVSIENSIESSKNNNDFRQFTLNLKDGLELKFTVFKSGYVSYGYSNIFFKLDVSDIDKLWKQ